MSHALFRTRGGEFCMPVPVPAPVFLHLRPVQRKRQFGGWDGGPCCHAARSAGRTSGFLSGGTGRAPGVPVHAHRGYRGTCWRARQGKACCITPGVRQCTPGLDARVGSERAARGRLAGKGVVHGQPDRRSRMAPQAHGRRARRSLCAAQTSISVSGWLSMSAQMAAQTVICAEGTAATMRAACSRPDSSAPCAVPG